MKPNPLQLLQFVHDALFFSASNANQFESTAHADKFKRAFQFAFAKKFDSQLNYVELGSGSGEGFVTIFNARNEHEKRTTMLAVDNFSIQGPIQPSDKNVYDIRLFELIKKKSNNLQLDFYESDCIDPIGNGDVNWIFYDAEHTIDAHRNWLLNWQVKFSDVCCVWIDDWDFPVVRKGTEQALTNRLFNFNVKHSVELTNSAKSSPKLSELIKGSGADASDMFLYPLKIFILERK